LALMMCEAPIARAQSTEQCAIAYERAQRSRKDGALKDALAQSILCASDACPLALRRECTEWIAPIRAATPSISVRVLGSDGCDVVDAKISVDATIVATRSDGQAIDLDPGVHKLRVEPKGSAPHEQQVVLAQGEKSRAITVRLGPSDVVCGAPPVAPPAAPAPPISSRESPPARPTPALVYVLGATGIVALGVAGGFAISGFSQKSTLDACSPTCPHDDVDSMRSTFVVADVAGILGLASLAAAGILHLTRPTVAAR